LAEYPFPALLSERIKFELVKHLTALACLGIFKAKRSRSISYVFDARRWRFDDSIEHGFIHPLLHKLDPTGRSGRLPRQKAANFRGNGITFPDSCGCKLADRD